METGEVREMPALPEKLVERILALVPFPFIFKARALSKAWLARLSPVSFAHDNEDKGLAISFQRRMAQYWSTKWPTFCPVVICKKDLMAYYRASRQWQRLPALSYFRPKNLRMSSDQMQGALYLISFINRKFVASEWRSEEVYVANVLTQSWKQLPPCPRSTEVLCRGFCFTRTVVTNTETCKVIEIHEFLHRQDLHLALIYDSKEDAWKRKMVDVPADFEVFLKGAHFNGAVYWVVGPSGEPKGLLAFNIEEETFQILQLPAFDLPAEHVWDIFDLVVCDGSLVMVVCHQGSIFAERRERVVVVIKIDLESRRWLEVTRGPSDYWECVFVGSDGDCLYIVGKHITPTYTESVYEYNLKNDEWSTFPLPGNKFGRYRFCSSSFQPGLNPFLAL